MLDSLLKLIKILILGVFLVWVIKIIGVTTIIDTIREIIGGVINGG